MDTRILKSSFVFAVSLAMNLISIDARAAHVSRCDDGSGTEIYTDGSCHALGAQPTPMSAELLSGLAREGGLDGLNLATVPMDSERLNSRLANPAAARCARTPQQLAATLREALARGDVNQLATAYDWTGMSGSQSKPILQRLQRMSDRPLIDGQYFDANEGVVQLVQGPPSAPTVTEFAVTRRAGCLFLQL
jgi:hypothetical protein